MITYFTLKCCFILFLTKAWPTNGRMDGQMDGRTDQRTDGQTRLQRCEDASKKREWAVDLWKRFWHCLFLSMIFRCLYLSMIPTYEQDRRAGGRAEKEIEPGANARREGLRHDWSQTARAKRRLVEKRENCLSVYYDASFCYTAFPCLYLVMMKLAHEQMRRGKRNVTRHRCTLKLLLLVVLLFLLLLLFSVPPLLFSAKSNCHC